jgi:DNA-binding NtrC family response regulator
VRPRLLVVDDEASIRLVVRKLAEGDHDVFEAGDGEEGLRLVMEILPDVLVTDVIMPGGGGIELAREALARLPDLAVVAMTGMGTVPDFVEFFRLGVADFLTKPFSADELHRSLVRALETRRLRAENARLRRTLGSVEPLGGIVGRSAAMAELRSQIGQVATTDASVLITGHSGTGKELVALAIHRLSLRHEGPFVAVHSGAFAAGLIESELFGHAKGAFTGAAVAREGRFEQAAGGTIFLDEIGTMGDGVQSQLLRVLQERTITRVGDHAARPIDVRVVAATNSDLPALTAAGKFRPDLLYRLDVVQIRVPDLSERRDDIPLLAAHFVETACTRMGRPRRTVTQAAMRRLLAHDWPGHVRELENVIEAAVISAAGREAIEEGDILLPARAAAPAAARIVLPPQGFDLDRALAEEEGRFIDVALARTHGQIAAAATLLHMNRSTLSRRIEEMRGER